MRELGGKLREELKPGAVVLSNVFTIPGWSAAEFKDGVHLYRVNEQAQRELPRTDGEGQTGDAAGREQLTDTEMRGSRAPHDVVH